MADPKSQGHAGSVVHRCRVQAQGGGIEESVVWHRDTSPTESDGHRMLDELKAKLSPSEQAKRERAFAEAHKFIQRAARAGGVDAPAVPKSYSSVLGGGIRVDIEFIQGKLFVPDP